jgi:hypothetical protein
MKQKSVFFILSILNLAGVANAQAEPSKSNVVYVDDTNVVVRVNKEHSLQGDSILKELSKNGVYIDQLSQVATHEEKAFIDIGCFNCIIITKHFSNTIQHSENESIKIPNNSGQ